MADHIPSLEYVTRRIGELSRELSLLRSLRRILRRHEATCEAAARLRELRTKRGEAANER